jgi:protein TonB
MQLKLPINFSFTGAEFPGGLDSMYAFIYRIINYPQKAMDSNIQGRVVVTFIVEKDGQILDASVLEDIGGGCGEEAIRVIKAMPKWKPATLNGELVRMQLKLPINFSLELQPRVSRIRDFFTKKRRRTAK